MSLCHLRLVAIRAITVRARDCSSWSRSVLTVAGQRPTRSTVRLQTHCSSPTQPNPAQPSRCRCGTKRSGCPLSVYSLSPSPFVPCGSAGSPPPFSLLPCSAGTRQTSLPAPYTYRHIQVCCLSHLLSAFRCNLRLRLGSLVSMTWVIFLFQSELASVVSY